MSKVKLPILCCLFETDSQSHITSNVMIPISQKTNRNELITCRNRKENIIVTIGMGIMCELFSLNFMADKNFKGENLSQL